MRRLPLLLLVTLAATAFAPGHAGAATPCRDKIFNDWYHDGKIASTYPIACYRDALKHIPPDVRVYTGLGDDIRYAMQAALDRSHGKPEPAQVSRNTSSGGPTHSSRTSSDPKHHSTTSTAPTSPDPGGGATTTTKAPTPVVAVAPASSSSSGVPVPVLVLGGVALLLVASGGIGLGIRHFRG